MIVGDLFSNGVQHTIPWLVAMTLVVVVDLLTGQRKVRQALRDKINELEKAVGDE